MILKMFFLLIQILYQKEDTGIFVQGVLLSTELQTCNIFIKSHLCFFLYGFTDVL
jgi:hypothetical protein